MHQKGIFVTFSTHDEFASLNEKTGYQYSFQPLLSFVTKMESNAVFRFTYYPSYSIQNLN